MDRFSMTSVKNDGKRMEEERRELSVRGILEFADCDMEDIRDIIGRQIRLNTAISQESWIIPGAQIGKTLENAWGGSSCRPCQGGNRMMPGWAAVPCRL